MTWDYAEAPPFGGTSGNWLAGIEWITKAVEAFPLRGSGTATQADAAVQQVSRDKLLSTDPPYYDNIGYAEWIARSFRERCALSGLRIENR